MARGRRGSVEGLEVAVITTGTHELIRSLSKAPNAMKKELRKKYRDVAKHLVDATKQKARLEGLVGKGTSGHGRTRKSLVGSVRAKIDWGQLWIYVDASRKSENKGQKRKVRRRWPNPYPYPRRYEFGQGRSRAFLRPTIEKNREKTVQKFREAMQEIERQWPL